MGEERPLSGRPDYQFHPAFRKQEQTSWRLCPTIAHHPVPGRSKTLRSLHSTADHQQIVLLNRDRRTE
jgi:hypothetical protein